VIQCRSADTTDGSWFVNGFRHDSDNLIAACITAHAGKLARPIIRHRRYGILIF